MSADNELFRNLPSEEINDPEIKTEYVKLVKSCIEIDSTHSHESLETLSSDFKVKQKEMESMLERFHSEVFDIPLSSIILSWAEEAGKNKVSGKKYIHLMNDLVSNQVLKLTVVSNNSVVSLTLGEFIKQNGGKLENVPDNIRCFSEWTIDKQEDCVLFICEFFKWLSHVTFGAVKEVVDRDRSLTRSRLISYEKYIELLKAMDFREQVLAKLFYLCEVKSLKKILNLRIEEAEYINRGILKLDEDWIPLPLHLVKDILLLVGERQKGYIFEGKNGGRLNETTPYRALKTVAAKLKLEESFTFNHLARHKI